MDRKLNRIESAYYNEVGKFPVLKRDEEKALLLKFHLEGDQKAFEKLVNSNLRFVLFVLKKHYSGWLWAFDNAKQDLIDEGNIGLMMGVNRYDIANVDTVTLNSYAVWWIKAKIDDYIMNNFHMIRLPANKFAEMQKLKQQLLKMTKDEAVKLNGRPIGEIDEMDISMHPLDEDVAVNDYWFKRIDDDIDAKRKISLALEKLKPREGQVVKMYFGIGLQGHHMTLEEIGQKMNVSKELIRLVKNKAIKKLRKIFDIQEMEDRLQKNY